jgi:5-methylphenazine-1-carboxylate 1-monooxygenase
VEPFVRDRFQLDFVDPLALIQASGTFYEYPLCDRDPLPRWSFGRATLLGDAAHPMYPVGANGGSQAVVDARVLAEELARDFPDGLRRYEDIRRIETADVVAANREMHAAGATQQPRELARVAGKYRRDTHADRIPT